MEESSKRLPRMVSSIMPQEGSSILNAAVGVWYGLLKVWK
jgi:hypothetical protein